jgi:High potential iron-sulfur protein
MVEVNRRLFVKAGTCGLSLTTLAARGEDPAPRVSEADPTALELGYKQDTSKVDQAKYPGHTPAQRCAGCQMYQSRTGDEWAGCILFSPKQVAANGWCNQWFERTA